MVKVSILFLFIYLGVGVSNKSYAASNEVEILAKINNAYGGELLMQAKSVRILDKYKQFYSDQGISADFTEVFKYHIDLTIDFEQKRKSLTVWESKDRGNRLIQTIVDETDGTEYNVLHAQFEKNDAIQYKQLGSLSIQTHDTLLARLLLLHPEKTKRIENAYFRGVTHHKLSMSLEDWPELTLWIDSHTGLITKVSRPYRNGDKIEYVFSNYAQKQGVTFAKDFQLNIAGEPYRISTSKDIEINPLFPNVAGGAENYSKRGKTIDTRSMVVKSFSHGAYYVGQGHRFSLFYDAGDYFYGVGGNSQLKSRFEALQQYLNTNKPLKFQVATHHHSDHLEGMIDAYRLGATFITVDAHIPAIQKAIGSTIDKKRVVTVKQQSHFEQGNFQVFNIPSSHSNQNLMVYLPKSKLMFTADHFSSDLVSDLPNVDKGTVILHKAIKTLDIDVNKFVGAHGSRVLSKNELARVSASFKKELCPNNLRVCID